MSGKLPSADRVTLRVRYAETDQMGRAHHMQYLAWFEMGRTELMRTSGVAYSDLEDAGVFLPVSRAEIEYRRGAGYDEEIQVVTRLEEVRSRTVTFAYEANREEDEMLLARGRTQLVCTDSAGRPRRIPEDLLEVLHRIMDDDHPPPDGREVS
jgi:acyl-CoA thioester hydrolase